MDVHEFLAVTGVSDDPEPSNATAVSCCFCRAGVLAGGASLIRFDGELQWAHYVRCPGDRSHLRAAS